jgi:hypothetical protein
MFSRDIQKDAEMSESDNFPKSFRAIANKRAVVENRTTLDKSGTVVEQVNGENLNVSGSIDSDENSSVKFGEIEEFKAEEVPSSEQSYSEVKKRLISQVRRKPRMTKRC